MFYGTVPIQYSDGVRESEAITCITGWNVVRSIMQDNKNPDRTSLEITNDLLAYALDSLVCGVMICDMTKTNRPIIYVNEALCRMTGYSSHEFIGSNSRFLQGPDTDPSAIERVRQEISRGKSYTVDLYNYRKDGSGFYNRIHLSPIVDESGNVNYYSSIQYDVTAERELHGLLQQQNTAFSNVLAASPSGVIIIDSNDMVLYANRAAEYLLSERGLSLVGRYIPLEVSNEGRHEFEFQCGDGQTIIAEVVVVQTRWADMPARVVMIRDISAVHAAEKRAAYAESYDNLTGLANRSRLREYLQEITDNIKQNLNAALILFDIKNFHVINDRYGFSRGDSILVEIAERLNGIVDDSGLAARVGGDRFALLFGSVNSKDALSRKALDLITLLKKPYREDIDTDSLKFNCGVAITEPGCDPDDLIKNAEIALKSSKNQDNNDPPFQMYSRELAEEEKKLQALDIQLRQAMLRDQFCVYYQPQVRLGDRKLVGFEALVRWQHPTEGILPPIAFIQRLEKLKLIATLGHDVLRKVSRQLVEWSGHFKSPARIAVNLSAVQLGNIQTADALHYAINEGGGTPDRITLELTESAALADMNTTIDILSRLRSNGIALALDDFGTGYSALSHLRVLPVDTVKLDRSFVSELPANTTDAGLVRAMVEMSHALGKKVIAEGVETEEQEQYLIDIGCDWAQGFLYGKPEPVEIIESRWLADN